MHTPAPTAPIVVRAQTAAKLLDCSRAHIYQLIERGQLTRIRIPGSKAVRIPIAEVYRLAGQEAPNDAA